MVLLSLWKPQDHDEERVKADGLKRGWNYGPVGATQQPILAMASMQRDGWVIDHVRVKVGHGHKAFRRAKDVLDRWGHFELGWASVQPGTPTAAGAAVAVTSKSLFLWACNPLRIVYSSYAKPPLLRLPWSPRVPRAYSFAHGCLKGHLLAGEESFTLEQDNDGAVWYEVRTFSRPAHPLSLATYPLVRFYQKAFGRDSARAMVQAAGQ